MPPRKTELALYLLPKHHVLHEVVYNFKKKDQAMLCRSNIIKICFGDHSVFPMAGHGAERRGKGPSHLTPAHGTRSYWPWECCCSSHAPSQQPPASGGQQTASGAKGVPPGKLQPAFTELQHFLHYFPSRASWKWSTTCIQREKNLILSSESCGEISSKLSPGTRLLDTNLSPVTLWRLQHKPS